MKRIAQLALCFSLCAAAALGQERSQWLDVPFVKQSEEGCGSAAISMLLQYWAAHGAVHDGERADVDGIQRQLYDKTAHGIYASAVERYLRESGFTVFSIKGTWDDLERHLKEGRPLILGTAPNGGKGRLHYLVAVGMDAKTPALLVNDPARGKLLRIERAAFEKQWQPVGNWTLVAVPSQAK